MEKVESLVVETEDYMDKVRLIILGEASTLSTFFLKNNQRITKSSYAQLSRLSSLIFEDEEEVDPDDEYLVVDPLIKSLILLKSRLSKEKLVSLDAFHLRPFCDVIVNKDISGPITGLALQSVLKFFNYGFIKDGELVRLIGESVTKVRFVGTDSNSDEVVLMRILAVLEKLIVEPFYLLTNGLVCEIMQSCFRIAFETRLSELLRKCAVKSLTEMVRALFGRISHFDQDVSDYNYFYQDKSNASFHKLNRMGRRFNVNHHLNKHHNKITKEDLSGSDCNQKSYGLACIHELLSYLTSLVNPLPDGQNTDTMIAVGLNLLIVIFETSVHDIGTKYCLLNVVKTDLCWNIMQLLQNDKNVNLFASVLRLAFLIFISLRMHLKYQLEAFLLRMADLVVNMNSPLECRDICLEYLLLLFRHLPYLTHELFFNFDCDPYSSNTMEELLQLFSKNCFATSHVQVNVAPSATLNFTTLQMLSFEALLANIKSLQKGALGKENYLVANPATMMVNISSMKEAFQGKISDEKTHIQSPVMEVNIDMPHMEVNDQTNNLTTAADTAESSEFSHLSTSTPAVNVASNNGNQVEVDNFEFVHKSTASLNDLSPREETESNIEPTVMGGDTVSGQVNKYCVTYLFPDANSVLHTSEQIIELKKRKSLLWQATEKFNQKPSKGIEFMWENNLVFSNDDIVSFLKNNPRLDKKQIGEYLSNKKNLSILTKFVESFAFKDIRIDEALRLYLESFRLPGEAPLISMVLEQFAHHWHESNNCPFVNEDAAFSLAYAIIMLNVDQHNSNVKRQANPMTCDEFISNLRQVNGGKDFDRNMLSDIYHMIKSNEIIMPAEQTGVVREKYLWKRLLKNSETVNGVYWYYEDRTLLQSNNFGSLENFKDHRGFCVNVDIINKPVFDISWGPSISTLTLVFDKLNPDKQPTLSRRVLTSGFVSCALLCANYGHLDNLVVSLSKFVISSSKITSKSELVAHCLFGITKEYANEMRTSWTNIIELILFWYDNQLLDDGFEIDDFAIEGKKIKFVRKFSSKSVRLMNENVNQSNFLSSFYSYFASNAQSDENAYIVGDNELEKPTANSVKANISNRETATINDASSVNEYCQALVSIIEESKFLHIDSLIELIKALINVQFGEEFDDDIEVFKLEILVKVILMNRDRLSVFWEHINRHLSRLMQYSVRSEYLTERVISTVFRLAIRFTPRPDALNEQIFGLIYQMLLIFEPVLLQRNVTALALHSFVSHCNCYFSKNEEWALIFNLILAVAIGFYPPNKKPSHVEYADTTVRGYTSDTEVSSSTVSKARIQPSSSTADLNKLSNLNDLKKNYNDKIFTVSYNYRILDVDAYEKCVDILSFIIREYLPNNSKTLPNRTAYQSTINSYDIAQMAVSVLYKFVEASIKIQLIPTRMSRETNLSFKSNVKERSSNKSRLSRLTNAILSSSESDSEEELCEPQSQTQPKLSSVTESTSLKLLDLMHFFHLNASVVVGETASSELLWNSIWCPLLQAISFFCCDCRRPVRTYAFTFLQRTLLLHDLNALNSVQWESCFNKVLFPLLSKLLEPINMCDPIGMDETRMRTTNLLCKVFLQHLPPLLGLNTFTALWLTILDFMDKYIKADMQTDLVKEAIPESLKNILLVMKTAGYFNDTLAAITWDRINLFLPNLHQELIPSTESELTNAPNINVPNINVPNINVPNINVPNINAPNINVPNINAPNMVVVGVPQNQNLPHLDTVEQSRQEPVSINMEYSNNNQLHQANTMFCEVPGQVVQTCVNQQLSNETNANATTNEGITSSPYQVLRL